MDHSLYFPAVVAASDFDPFTREVVMPVTVQSSSTRPRASMKPGGVTRPARRNLLELGLACGQGAVELEAEAHKADAVRREAERAAGHDRGGAAEDVGKADDAAEKDAALPDPAAIAATATEIRELGRKRDRLAEELADLDRQRAELQAELMRLLGRKDRGVPSQPEAADVPPGAGLPMAAWR